MRRILWTATIRQTFMWLTWICHSAIFCSNFFVVYQLLFVLLNRFSTFSPERWNLECKQWKTIIWHCRNSFFNSPLLPPKRLIHFCFLEIGYRFFSSLFCFPIVFSRWFASGVHGNEDDVHLLVFIFFRCMTTQSLDETWIIETEKKLPSVVWNRISIWCYCDLSFCTSVQESMNILNVKRAINPKAKKEKNLSLKL